MKIRKAGIAAGMAVLFGAAVVGGTYAWFTDQASADNQLEMGHVEIELSEEQYDKHQQNGEYQQLLPGMAVMKDLMIRLKEGSESAYIRIKNPIVEVGDPVKWRGELVGGEDLFQARIADGWVRHQDYYYYQEALRGDSKVAFLKEQGDGEEHYTLKMPLLWDNRFAGQTIRIVYEVEAIQSKNITLKTDGSTPWPAEDIVEYTQTQKIR